MTLKTIVLAPRWMLLWVFLLSACAVPPSVQPAPEAVRAHTLAAVQALGQAGDWLVIRGLHPSDDLVSVVTQMPLSHVGVLDAANHAVIEAEGIGVHQSSLPDFVDKAHRLLLIRPMWAHADAGPLAITRARALVGQRYDYLGLLGINVGDRYYCSELAVSIYHPGGAPSGLPPVLAPGLLYQWGTIVYDSGPAAVDASPMGAPAGS